MRDLGPEQWRFHPPGRGPAPGGLSLVQAFLNTVNHEHGRDVLAAADGFNGWLDDVGLAGPATAIDARDGRLLREAIRASLDGHALPADRALVERAATGAHLTLRADGSRLRLDPLAPGVAGVFGRIVVALAEAEAAGDLRRLKTCRACRWAFYDTSRNCSGIWCSMEICGNRRKVRSYRARGRST